jgi:uncharacterized protein YbjT (DUF2867 family)
MDCCSLGRSLNKKATSRKQNIMTKRTYVVTGATGNVGEVLVGKLKAAGHRVRPVSRSAGVPFDDAAALTRAFSGVDGAFS